MVATLEKLQPPRSLGVFLIVEAIDVFEISVKEEVEFCGG
jgi:hypothetical protein